MGNNISCGQWYSNECVGKTDRRYDPDATNVITDQDSLWAKQDGFWKGVTEKFDGEGNRKQPQFFDPTDLANSRGLPYDQGQIVFVNISFVGTRLYEHRYAIYPPAPQDFCELTPPSRAAQNALFNGTCGVNGFATYTERFFVSSYEKDGSVVGIGGSAGFSQDGGFNPGNYSGFAIGDKSIYTEITQSVNNGTTLGTKTWVFTEPTFSQAIGQRTSHNIKDPENIFITSFTRIHYTKLESEEAFVNAIAQAWEENKVQKERKPSNGVLPMPGDCLGTHCPTEEDWCTIDPSCSASPYQEPTSELKGGVVGGIVVLVLVVLLAGLYVGYLRKMKKQREKLKRIFAGRITEQVNLRGSTNQLHPKALQEEFEKIDAGLGGTGEITKDELWRFMSSGKAGDISEFEFNALFAIMDSDKSGTVDFLEFCAYLSQCGEELDEAQMKQKLVLGKVKPESRRVSLQLAASEIHRNSTQMSPNDKTEAADEEEKV